MAKYALPSLSSSVSRKEEDVDETPTLEPCFYTSAENRSKITLGWGYIILLLEMKTCATSPWKAEGQMKSSDKKHKGCLRSTLIITHRHVINDAKCGSMPHDKSTSSRQGHPHSTVEADEERARPPPLHQSLCLWPHLEFERCARFSTGTLSGIVTDWDI